MGDAAAAQVSGDGQRSGMTAPWLPWVVWALTFVAITGAAVDLDDPTAIGPVSRAALAIGVLSMATIGALVASKGNVPRPGWLLLGSSLLWSIYLYAYRLLELVAAGRLGRSTTSSRVLAAIGDEAAFLAIMGTLILLVTVPDGTVHRGPSRWAVRLVGVLVVTWTVQTVALSAAIVDLDAWVSRSSIASLEGAAPGPLLAAGTTVLTVLSLPIIPIVALALIQRYLSSRGEERQQLKWILFGGLAVLLWLAGSVPTAEDAIWSTVQSVLPGAALVLMALAFGLALFKYRLWDVDLVVRRSLVYGMLWLVIVGVYALVAAALGLFAIARLPVEVAVLLTIAATLVFQPARRWLEVLADRWVFGRRDSAAVALQSLGTSASTQTAPSAIAADLASVTMRTVRPEWVGVELDGSTGARLGTRMANASLESVPIEWGGERIGMVRCQLQPGSQLTGDERALLEALAGHVALAVSHTRLLARTVDAQDRERRRIERDIHDGAQQDIAALMGQLGLARSRVNGDPQLRETFDRLHGDAQRILSSVRDLAQGVHPSVLRDRGLVAAIEDRRASVPVQLRIEATGGMATRRYEPTVEAAAYFTVSEALANAVKHSGAQAVDLRVEERDDVLRIEVTDHGDGFDQSRASSGTGLTGMADRVMAVGGTLDINSRIGTGSTVRLAIPLRRAGDAL